MSVLYSKNPNRNSALREMFTDFVKQLDFPDTGDEAVANIVDAMEREVEKLDNIANESKAEK